jgi:toxin CptA
LSLHNAPSVSYPLGRSRFLGCLLLGAWLVAAGVSLWWWRTAPPGDWRPWVGCLSWLLAGLAMAAGWHRSPVGALHWDGELWFWESQACRDGSALAPPVVAIDLQTVMLLRLDNPAGAVWWLWAERATWPERWLDLRRAVHTGRRAVNLQVSETDPRHSG